jgi:hypothetical protein
VHTENEPNKEKRKTGAGPRVSPGQQVATNTAMHCNMRLFENAEGEYDAVVDRIEKPTLVRGEYIPIGSNFHYPKQWGRKYAAKTLLEYIMADRRRQIELAEKELAKLERCMERIQGWSDTDE